MTTQEQVNMEALKAEIEKIKAENALLKAKKEKALTLKVSAKGAVSLYGMGRFPVTLYGNQWLKVLAIADQIKAFIETNKTTISFDKSDAPAATETKAA